jgi:hypothetical protein
MYCNYFQIEVKFCNWDLKLSPVCINCREGKYIPSPDSPQGCIIGLDRYAVNGLLPKNP